MGGGDVANLTRAWRGGGQEKEETLISISAVVEAVQRRRRDLQVEPQRGADFNPADFTLSYSGGGGDATERKFGVKRRRKVG